MPDYPAMYRKLFAAQVDAINELKEITDHLVRTHRQVEEMYMSVPEPDIVVLKPERSTDNSPQED